MAMAIMENSYVSGLCALCMGSLRVLTNSPLDVSINTVLQVRRLTHGGWLSGLRLYS